VEKDLVVKLLETARNGSFVSSRKVFSDEEFDNVDLRGSFRSYAQCTSLPQSAAHLWTSMISTHASYFP
jgi:hypothetical protein